MSATLLRDWELRDWPHRGFSRFVARGGIHWHVQVMGTGPVLLLLHGTGASTHSFRELMPLLAEHFTVVAPDLPGHAFTRVPPLFVPSLPAMAAALDELLEELKLEPVVAVGHSAGAAILARMTLDGSLHTELLVGLAAALVPLRGVARALLGPTARVLAQSFIGPAFIALRARDTASVTRLLRSTGSSIDARGVELYRRLSERPGHVSAVLAMMASWELDGLWDELPSLTTPLLLLAGDGDRATPLAQQRESTARVPNARLEVVTGAGHLLHEEQPALIARKILEATKLQDCVNLA